MKILAIIPARAGSQRLAKKNIYPVWGKPMLYWAIQACKRSRHNIQICVSTDGEEISSVAESLGATIHKRPKKLSDDKTYKQEVVRAAASWYEKNHGKQDVFISLQPNSPEIKPKDLDQAIDKLLKYKKNEILSVDSNLMQNAAFRILKGDYVYQQDLSTNCGVYVCDLKDVHDIDDIKSLEQEHE